MNNNNVICPKCGGLFVGGIRANSVSVSVGPPIPRQEFKSKVCDKLNEGSSCLIRSLLAKIDITNKLISRGDFMSNEEIYTIAKQIFKEHNIQTSDYLVKLDNLIATNLFIDQEYVFTLYIGSKRYDNVVLSFTNTYTQAYVQLKAPFNYDVTGVDFDLFDGSTLVAEGVFA